MSKQEKISLVTLPVILLIAAGLSWAGSQGSAHWNGLPIFALAVGFAFVVNWLAFIPAWLLHTEKFFDLMGGVTFLSVTTLAMALTPVRDGGAWLLAGMITVWALRLSLFLFVRIRKAGADARFDEIKVSLPRFLLTWTLQGLWAAVTLAAALAAITAKTRTPPGFWAALGAAVWLFGFVFEVVADVQKSRFRADPNNRDQFIRTGLWAWSRHPNYFGEIMVWIGVALVALPMLAGWHWLTLTSPPFVVLLLTRVSGIPMLEARADEKWGSQPDYEAYKASTPILIPRIPKKP